MQLFDGNNLRNFEAKDDDAREFGDITFMFVNSESYDNFKIVKINRKQSELQVTDNIEEKSYMVSIFKTENS